TQAVQIIDEEGKTYLIQGGWLKDLATSTVSVREQNGSYIVTTEQSQYPAKLLTEEQIDEFHQRDYTGFFILGLLFLAAVTIGSVLNYLQTNFLQYAGQHIIFKMRQQLFEHLSKMSSSYFDRNPVGRLVVRVTQD